MEVHGKIHSVRDYINSLHVLLFCLALLSTIYRTPRLLSKSLTKPNVFCSSPKNIWRHLNPRSKEEEEETNILIKIIVNEFNTLWRINTFVSGLMTESTHIFQVHWLKAFLQVDKKLLAQRYIQTHARIHTLEVFYNSTSTWIVWFVKIGNILILN